LTWFFICSIAICPFTFSIRSNLLCNWSLKNYSVVSGNVWTGGTWTSLFYSSTLLKYVSSINFSSFWL
jgi:hypothetical protein